jgi:hypothetical protein
VLIERRAPPPIGTLRTVVGWVMAMASLE